MRLLRLPQFNLISLLLASQSAFADLQFNLTEGVTPVSHDIYGLHMTIFWICVAIGLVVFGFMIYSFIYHRKSKGFKAAKFHEHLSIELTWTVIPCLILIIMAIPATRVLVHMNDEAAPDVTIKITGYQWKWRYEYLDSDIHFFSNGSTPYDQIHGTARKDALYLRQVDKPLYVPIHKKIRFLITSNDVIHSWWMPDFGIKRDAIPGFINESWARVNRAGIYYGQCSKLCGINHAYMQIVVIAVPEKDFDNWVAAQKGLPITGQPQTAVVVPQPAGTTKAPAAAQAANAPVKFTLADAMQRGEKVFLGTCAVCHKPDGSGMPPTFPALKGSKVATGPRDAHINTVLNGKPGTAMQAFKEQFSDEDLAAVITYERNAFGNNTGDVIQPDDIKKAKGEK